ncbi:FAD-dependent oxidoreductase [Streptomyces sp. HMX112]|uniref:FAD-dependent oxidoreductase n=1 Tax=Streptomyces sp. HMX112 TaxID=3390850 RepID=UPI003A7F9994
MEDTYDIVVIGGGPAGEVAADRTVRSGLTAVVIEAEAVGGECSYRACVPGKALLRPGAARAEARSVEGARQAVTAELDPAHVLARRDRFTRCGDDTGQADWLDGAGIALVRGHVRLAGERRVEVTGADGAVRTLRAWHAVVVCTGAEPALPSVEGIDGIGVDQPAGHHSRCGARSACRHRRGSGGLRDGPRVELARLLRHSAGP